MFLRLANDKYKSQRILIENEFITDYMPFADETSIKVYLYGLSLAQSGTDNSVEMLTNKLNLSSEEVISSYKYWEEQGLISFLSINPPLVEYKEVVPIEKQLKYYNKAKYKAFNEQLHAIMKSRVILPNEYREYYYAIENLHIEKEAMLTIIAYCIRLKGENVRSSYILAVARNLALEGFTTYERVSNRLDELDLYSNEIKAVLKALSNKREPDINDKRLWIKWTKSLGFTQETIIKVAKNQKKGGIEKLDSSLSRYYENRVLTYEEIEKFNQNKDKLFKLTAEIVRTLGKYYDRLDYITETYTQKWLNFGFDNNALLKIADYCFKRNYKNLEDMDSVILNFYNKGLLNSDSIDEFNNKVAEKDEIIKGILEKCGILRNVNSWDRDFYRTWTYSWNMPLEVIEYASSKAVGKGLPYINAILANLNSKGIHDLEKAKKEGEIKFNATTTISGSTVTTKSVEELQSVFGEVKLEDL